MAQSAAAGADTFPKLLVRNARIYGARPAMRHKDLGIWQSWTWSQVLDIVRAYAVGLHRLGLKRGETIAIVGANRPNSIGRSWLLRCSVRSPCRFTPMLWPTS